MDAYKTNIKRLAGTNHLEVQKNAKRIYKNLTSGSRRRPHIRSKFFKGQKVFLDYFWQHIFEKEKADRLRRLRQYPCAIDLIRNSMAKPISKINPENSTEILHRFKGINGNSEIFYVQIKENIKTQEKIFISAFPQ